MKKGLFITFEGADGCGKTTQINKISELLKEKGFEVVLTREPGSLEVGKKIRDIVLHHDGIVFCDRHTDSTLAYQGYGRGRDIEKLDNLNKIATNGLTPDLTILFDVDTDVAQTRVGNEKDRIESAGIEFHKKVRQGYLELAEKNKDRIKVVNANNSIETVYNDTKNIIIDLITKK